MTQNQHSSATWRGAKEPTFPPLSFGQKVRMALRGLAMVTLFAVTFPIYLIGVLIRYAIPGFALAPAMIWVFCAVGSWIMGLRVIVKGTPMKHGGARVANHSSWLDIFSYRTAAQIFFVAKSEVASWPVVGWIARSTGTMFIARKRTEAKTQQNQFLERLTRGDRLCFFPEGTSTDGQMVLPFKSSLFAAFLADGVRETAWVQPMTARYKAAPHLPANFYSWWGDMEFGAHVLQVLGRSTGGSVTVTFHPPVRAADYTDRKALARYCEDYVRAPFEADAP